MVRGEGLPDRPADVRQAAELRHPACAGRGHRLGHVRAIVLRACRCPGTRPRHPPARRRRRRRGRARPPSRRPPGRRGAVRRTRDRANSTGWPWRPPTTGRTIGACVRRKASRTARAVSGRTSGASTRCTSTASTPGRSATARPASTDESCPSSRRGFSMTRAGSPARPTRRRNGLMLGARHDDQVVDSGLEERPADARDEGVAADRQERLGPPHARRGAGGEDDANHHDGAHGSAGAGPRQRGGGVLESAT